MPFCPSCNYNRLPLVFPHPRIDKHIDRIHCATRIKVAEWAEQGGTRNTLIRWDLIKIRVTLRVAIFGFKLDATSRLGVLG